jgi:hypothetical protein
MISELTCKKCLVFMSFFPQIPVETNIGPRSRAGFVQVAVISVRAAFPKHCRQNEVNAEWPWPGQSVRYRASGKRYCNWDKESLAVPILISTTNQMNEINNLSSDFSDEFLQTQADAGDHFLSKESFEYHPTQEEMKALVLEGVSLLFIDCLKGK